MDRLIGTIRHWVAQLVRPLPGTLGERGERLAERALRTRGMRIVGRRVRTPEGEIDLVARDGSTWVFVEVKTRKSRDVQEALEAVTPDKQRRLTQLALAYLKRRHLLGQPARFDVIGISWPDGNHDPEIRHIANAFEASGSDGMYS